MKHLNSFLNSCFNENFKIREIGLRLDPKVKQEIKYKLNDLQDLVPVNSSIHISFQSVKKQIIGNLTIFTASKEFRAHRQGLNAIKVFRRLEKDIKKRIYSWKLNRFKEKTPEPLTKELAS